MSRLRIIFLASLVVLGVLLAFTVFKPMISGEKYSTVSRESVIQQEDRWIIQLDIINREGKDVNYIMAWSTEKVCYCEIVCHCRDVCCCENECHCENGCCCEVVCCCENECYCENVTIKDGRTFTYIHYVYPESVKEGKVNVAIHKEGEPTPFEQITYYIRCD